MKILILSLFYLIILLANCCCIHVALVSGQCGGDQQSLLLNMKNSLVFNSTLSVKLGQWGIRSTDCCEWRGVKCDGVGRVISLNLSNETIAGGIENATGLFGLKFLQSLNLAFNKFNATQIPSGLANITTLTYLNLSNAGFAGKIPSDISGLTKLVTLDFSSNQFDGPIPSFNMSKNLSYLDLSHNVLTGPISSTCWEQLPNLDYVDFTNNSLNGIIPPSLFSLPSLRKLQLANNRFQGRVPEISNASSYVIDTLDLSGNTLEGPIPMSVFELKKLQNLLLSFNKFNGTLQLETIQKLPNLIEVDLSYNSLAVSAASNTSYFLPHVNTLRLASCKLRVIPNLKNQPQVFDLDLSNNQISGEIPNWIWEVGNGGLTHLNLSHNFLAGMEEPYSISNLIMLDLHSNQFRGRIPYPPPTVVYVDYSSNNFSFAIPADIGHFLASTVFFSLSHNNLTGVVPESICSATKLQVLDLSSNNLSSSVPPCLFERSETLGVLNLRRNRLSGSTISGTFPENCGLQTLDLSGNQLEGILPNSLTNCLKLEVVNVGNNQFKDTFPCWLKHLFRLRVVVLRSNKLHGTLGCIENNVTWPLLQIVDLGSNNFSGGLPHKFLTNWEKMTLDESGAQSNLAQVRYEFRGFNQLYYQDEVTVIVKGEKAELAKILTLFTCIDLSCNNFQGPIPEEIGRLKWLHVVNLSHNALTGKIPSSVGEMRQLESVDLSVNNLSGEIPAEVVNLSFLSLLNVSYNHLVGRIPLCTQLQSFSESCFEGNEGLCGPPLTKECTNTSILLPESVPALSDEIHCDRLVVIAVGFVIGFGVAVAPLMFSKKVNKWYDDHINKYLQ